MDWEPALYDAALRAGLRKIGSIGVENYHLWILAKPDTEVGRELASWKRLARAPHRPNGISP